MRTPSWLRWTMFALLAISPTPAWAANEEAELAARLSEDATQLVEQLLGHGRGRVIATVEGERSETVSESNVDTPVDKFGSQDIPAMPGYKPSNLLEKTFTYVQRDQERSSRSKFTVNRISVSVLIDSRVAPEQAEGIRKVLSELLRLDQVRGDSITVVRAPIEPPWRAALLSPQVLSTLLGQALLALGLAFAALVLYVLGRQGIRAIGEAALMRRGGLEPGPPHAPVQTPEAFPTAAGPPSLLELDEPAAGLQDAGVSFSFLEQAPSEDLQAALGAEAPQDLALLFAHLADQRPEQSPVLFASLAPQVQLQVSQSMVRLNRAEPDQLAQLESRLRDRLAGTVRGPEKLGRILSRLTPDDRTSLLSQLSRVDAEGSDRVQGMMLTFEDLAAASDEDLRRVVIAVPLEVWADALHEGGDQFPRRVAELLPPGLGQSLREALARPVKKTAILEARSRVLSIALGLADKGQIQFKKRGRPEGVR